MIHYKIRTFEKYAQNPRRGTAYACTRDGNRTFRKYGTALIRTFEKYGSKPARGNRVRLCGDGIRLRNPKKNMTRLLIYMCPIWGPTCSCRQHQNSTIYQYEFHSGVASVLSESTNARTVLCESTTPPQPYFWKVRRNIKIVLSESTNSYFPKVRFGLKSYS